MSVSDRIWLKGLVEALLWVEALSSEELVKRSGASREEVLWVIELLKAEMAQEGRGCELKEEEGLYMLRAKTLYWAYLPKKMRPVLSKAALEIISLIAFEGPLALERLLEVFSRKSGLEDQLYSLERDGWIQRDENFFWQITARTREVFALLEMPRGRR